jgi:hypothetical protein
MNIKKNIKKVLKEETNKFELVKNFIYTMFDNVINLEYDSKINEIMVYHNKKEKLEISEICDMITNYTGLNVVPWYEYITKNKAEYYRCIKDVTEKNEWEDYILYMLDMIEETANKGLKRLNKITLAMDETAIEIKKKLPKVYSKDLIEILFRLPYTKRQHLINENIGNLKTVGNYLISLEENGFLKSEKVGKEKLYLNQRLLKILEDKE